MSHRRRAFATIALQKIGQYLWHTMTYSIQAQEGKLGWLRELWQRGRLKGLLLVVAVLFAYQPLWHAGFIWDDDDYVVNNIMLRSLKGLWLIWTEPGATPQYYPVVFTAFWVDYHLWKVAPFGYHLINILLHACSALLLWRILRRLEVPGAYLAGAIFALHPVCVETVAWVSELKNTLSGAFYLGAVLVYLRFDRTRNWKFYCFALGLFLLGLMCKTVISTLPAALLVVFWWQRGKLLWKHDVLPLIPFFAAGIGAGLVTVWVERNLVGAQGSEFNFSLIERVLIAGRVIWFYLGKLVWPADLIFNYTRWHVSQTVWWQYFFPAAALLVSLGLWLLSRRNRGPLAAFLFFVGTLFPALGFFNVYPFRFSFVADHFQYLASIGPITLAAAGIAKLFSSLKNKPPFLEPVFCGALLLVLGLLSWRQCGMYKNVETLWRTTIVRNPDAFLAYNNLGTALNDTGQVQEAIVYFRKTLQLKPDYALAHNNLGAALAQTGQIQDAIKEYQEALRLQRNYPEAQYNFGDTLLQAGQPQEAIKHFREALRLQPDYASAHDILGNALIQMGQPQEAIEHYQEALRLQSDFPEADCNLGAALVQTGHPQEAITHFERALQSKPNFPQDHNGLGVALLQNGQVEEGIAQFRTALQLQPDFTQARNNLGNALINFGYILSERGQPNQAIAYLHEGQQIHPDSTEAYNYLGLVFLSQGQAGEAVTNFQKALELQPDNVETQNNLAWVWATCPDASWRNGVKAVQLAQKANQLSGGQNPAILRTLAAAYAEAGRFPEALTTAQKALRLVESQTNAAPMANDLQMQIKCYQAGAPFHSRSLTNTPATTR